MQTKLEYDNNIQALLIRLDERTKNTDLIVTSIKTDAKETKEVLQAEIKENRVKMEQTIAAQNEKNEENFVNKESFSPVQKIVYGLVSLVLTAALTGAITLLVK